MQGDELQFMYRSAFGKRSCERCTKSLRKINYGNEGIVCEGDCAFLYYLLQCIVIGICVLFLSL